MGTRTPWRFRVVVVLVAFALWAVGMALDQRPLFSGLSVGVVIGGNVTFIAWAAWQERRRAAVDDRSRIGAPDGGDGHGAPR